VGKDATETVAAWAKRFQRDEANSVAELINLVLKAAGCDIGVDIDDIGDPDNASGRLSTIQDEFQLVRPCTIWRYRAIANMSITAKCCGLPSDCQRQRQRYV
jgi:hypothetical protein